MAFTTFAFDGLRRGRRVRRSNISRPGFGRIARGSKRPKETVCGCRVVMVPRGKRGGGTTGKRQPALKCKGTPMLKFIKASDVPKYRKSGRICTRMVKPLR
jgi:hypothetical protein